jgi:hypothetical protein
MKILYHLYPLLILGFAIGSWASANYQNQMNFNKNKITIETIDQNESTLDSYNNTIKQY